MAFTYRWLEGNRPDWADMVSTTFLNDGSVGDTTTGEQNTESDTGSSLYCAALSVETYITAQIYLGTAHTLSSFSFASYMAATVTGLALCLEDPVLGYPTIPSPSCVMTLEYSTNGSSWTHLTDVACTAPTPVDGSTASSTTIYSASITPVTCCWIRIIGHGNATIMTSDQTLAVEVGITDFRVTGTDTGSACSATPSASCDVALSASVTPSTAAVGASGTFTITATNNGPDATTATEVTILSPIGFNSPTYTPSQGTVTAGVWTIGAIAVGANKSCTIAGTIGRNGQLILSASVTGTTPDDVDTGNNYARATLIATPAAGTGCHCSEVHDGPCSGSFVFDGPCSGTWVVDDCPGGQPTTVAITWDTTDYKFDSTVVTFDMTEI